MSRLNLCDVTPETVVAKLNTFSGSLVTLAVIDFKKGVTKQPSGNELCSALCSEWRNLHEKMATTIYRSTIRSLSASKKEQEDLDS